MRAHRTLARAARPSVVWQNVGRVWVVVAALLAVPVAASLGLGDPRLALAEAGVALALGVLGLALRRLPGAGDLQPNEAMATTALVFATVPVAMVPIFLAAGLAPADALFEAVAAVTTAGLTMLESVERLPPAFLFARAWMQWFGGLGFVALCAALMVGPGVAARRIAAEFDRDPGTASSTHARARRVLLVYGGLTIAGFAALWATAGDPFLALVHALAAIATGGYSTFDRGLGGFAGYAPQAVLLVLCVLGALSFDLHGRLHRRQWRAFVSDPGLRALGFGIALVTVLVVLMEGARGARGLWDSLSLAVMAQTTAGFATRGFADLEPGTQGVLAISMLVGGDLGSTAGGIKLLRVVLLVRLVHLLVLRSTLPAHAVVAARVEGRRVAEPEIVALLAFLAMLGAAIAGSWLVFVAHGYPPFASLLEVIAAISTGGLSAGVTGPELPVALKLVLLADMLAGRLEIVALVVLCYPYTWAARRQRSA